MKKKLDNAISNLFEQNPDILKLSSTRLFDIQISYPMFIDTKHKLKENGCTANLILFNKNNKVTVDDFINQNQRFYDVDRFELI
jgi:hypothetical protein